MNLETEMFVATFTTIRRSLSEVSEIGDKVQMSELCVMVHPCWMFELCNDVPLLQMEFMGKKYSVREMREISE